MEKEIGNLIDYYLYEVLRVCVDQDTEEIRGLLETVIRASMTVILKEIERRVK
jgi:hypothetical protein